MRVVIADDSVLFREGLARVLADDGFEVVAQAGDSDALRDAVRNAKPTLSSWTCECRRHRPTRARASRRRFARSTRGVAVLMLSQTVEVKHAFDSSSQQPEGSGTCSRTASSTSTSFSRPCVGLRAGVRSSIPRS